MKPQTKRLNPKLAQLCQSIARLARAGGGSHPRGAWSTPTRPGVTLPGNLPRGGTLLVLRFPTAAIRKGDAQPLQELIGASQPIPSRITSTRKVTGSATPSASTAPARSTSPTKSRPPARQTPKEAHLDHHRSHHAEGRGRQNDRRHRPQPRPRARRPHRRPRRPRRAGERGRRARAAAGAARHAPAPGARARGRPVCRDPAQLLAAAGRRQPRPRSRRPCTAGRSRPSPPPWPTSTSTTSSSTPARRATCCTRSPTMRPTAWSSPRRSTTSAWWAWRSSSSRSPRCGQRGRRSK
jgi:hypothetical protein